MVKSGLLACLPGEAFWALVTSCARNMGGRPAKDGPMAVAAMNLSGEPLTGLPAVPSAPVGRCLPKPRCVPLQIGTGVGSGKQPIVLLPQPSRNGFVRPPNAKGPPHARLVGPDRPGAGIEYGRTQRQTMDSVTEGCPRNARNASRPQQAGQGSELFNQPPHARLEQPLAMQRCRVGSL